MKPGYNKTPERTAVEDCLALAGTAGRTIKTVMHHTGLEAPRARKLLAALVTANKAESFRTEGHHRWRMLSAVAKAQAGQAPQRVCTGTVGGVYVPHELAPLQRPPRRHGCI